MGHWGNQKGNKKKNSKNKWQWKYNNSKHMGCSKSSSKIEVHSKMPVLRSKIPNKQPNSMP